LESVHPGSQDFRRRLVVLSPSEIGGDESGRDGKSEFRSCSSAIEIARFEERWSSEKPSTWRRKRLKEERLSRRAFPFLEHSATLRVLGFSPVSLNVYKSGWIDNFYPSPTGQIVSIEKEMANKQVGTFPITIRKSPHIKEYHILN
jgi:hypothetical protein